MKTFKQYIQDLFEEVQIKKNPKRVPDAQWHNMLAEPNSIHAPEKNNQGIHPTIVSTPLLGRIRAWHNPPTQMDQSQIQRWAKNLGFGSEGKDPIVKGKAEFELVVPSRSTPSRALYMSDGNIRSVSVSNAWQDKNRKDLLPHIIKNIRDSAIRHGHVPSNIEDFVHQKRKAPVKKSEQDKILERQQSQQVMSAYNKTLFDPSELDKVGSEDLPSLVSNWSDWNNINPKKLIGHARNLMYSLGDFHNNWERIAMPEKLRRGAILSTFMPPHPVHEPSKFLIANVLKPHGKIKGPYRTLQNNYLNIIDSSERMGIEVPDSIHERMTHADNYFSMSSAFEGRENDYNKHIYGMLRSGKEYQLPSSPTNNKEANDNLSWIRSRVFNHQVAERLK